MTGSLKTLATTDAAIKQATSSHFSLEDCLSSIKSLMPLTDTHSILASNNCIPEKKFFALKLIKSDKVTYMYQRLIPATSNFLHFSQDKLLTIHAYIHASHGAQSFN